MWKSLVCSGRKIRQRATLIYKLICEGSATAGSSGALSLQKLPPQSWSQWWANCSEKKTETKRNSHKVMFSFLLSKKKAMVDTGDLVPESLMQKQDFGPKPPLPVLESAARPHFGSFTEIARFWKQFYGVPSTDRHQQTWLKQKKKNKLTRNKNVKQWHCASFMRPNPAESNNQL